MATEQQIQKKMIQRLEREGAYVVNTIATRAGVPDLMGCYNGRFFGIEVKHPDRKHNVSKLQQHNLDTITDGGGIAIVAWELKQVTQLLKDLDELTNN